MYATLAPPPSLRVQVTSDEEPEVNEKWTELPITPGQRLSDLPAFAALCREGWQLTNAYIGGHDPYRRYVRLYLTRPDVD